MAYIEDKRLQHFLLLEATEKNDIAALKKLLDGGARMDTENKETECVVSPLVYACRHGHLEAVRLLVCVHPTSTQSSTDHFECLKYAVSGGQIECIRLLLQLGFKVNATDDYTDKRTALHHALELEKAECVKILLEAGADIHQETLYGEPAIFFTATNKDVMCLQLLLERVADINICNLEGDTVLHKAAANGSARITMFLLDHGADMWRLNGKGVRPVEQIRRRNLEAYLDSLISTLPPSDDQEHRALVSFKALEPSQHSKVEFQKVQYFLESRRHRSLLKHPVIATFVYLKWRRILPFFLCNFLIFSAWVVSSSLYALDFIENVHLDEEQQDYQKKQSYIMESPHTETWLHYTVTTFLVMLICRESYQLITSRHRYFFVLENYMELSIISTAGTVVFTTHLPLYVERGCVILWPLLTWVELAFLIGRFPMFTKYIAMFTTVTRNYLTFLFPFSFIIAGFVLSFYLTFNFCVEGTCGSKFQGFPMAAVKTMVMMMGELDLNDFPYGKLQPFTLSLVLVFLFLIMLVLMNLLDALAVSDTQKIADEAELYGLVPIANLICYVEALFYRPEFSRAISRFCKCCPCLKNFICLVQKHLFEFVLILPKIPKRGVAIRLRTGHVEKTHVSVPEDVTINIQVRLERKKQESEEGIVSKSLSAIKENVKDVEKIGDELKAEITEIKNTMKKVLELLQLKK